eukprot:353005-Chlamydomonas_euryale.AAC.4
MAHPLFNFKLSRSTLRDSAVKATAMPGLSQHDAKNVIHPCITMNTPENADVAGQQSTGQLQLSC